MISFYFDLTSNLIHNDKIYKLNTWWIFSNKENHVLDHKTKYLEINARLYEERHLTAIS